MRLSRNLPELALVAAAAAAAVLAVGLAGCRDQTSSAPPIEYPSKLVDKLLGVTSMDVQPKLKANETNPFFPDGRNNRLPPAGTVAQGSLRASRPFFEGIGPDGQPLAGFPIELTRSLVERGRERYDIYCSPCHDRAGTGQGLTPKRGWLPPPSFHDDRIRAMTPGQLFEIATNGVRTMPGYRKQVPEHDRWAIVAYVQALQRSQLARADELPAGRVGP